jgi:hypothetical protein
VFLKVKFLNLYMIRRVFFVFEGKCAFAYEARLTFPSLNRGFVAPLDLRSFVADCILLEFFFGYKIWNRLFLPSLP